MTPVSEQVSLCVLCFLYRLRITTASTMVVYFHENVARLSLVRLVAHGMVVSEVW